jgi:hypothetical protein
MRSFPISIAAAGVRVFGGIKFPDLGDERVRRLLLLVPPRTAEAVELPLWAVPPLAMAVNLAPDSSLLIRRKLTKSCALDIRAVRIRPRSSCGFEL